MACKDKNVILSLSLWFGWAVLLTLAGPAQCLQSVGRSWRGLAGTAGLAPKRFHVVPLPPASLALGGGSGLRARAEVGKVSEAWAQKHTL